MIDLTTGPGVYLLHFASRISPVHTCQHYLGYGDDLARRTAEQLAGGCDAARLPQVARERGISAIVVRVWPGATRTDERRLKNGKNGPALCPVCREAKRPEPPPPPPPAPSEPGDEEPVPIGTPYPRGV